MKRKTVKERLLSDEARKNLKTLPRAQLVEEYENQMKELYQINRELSDGLQRAREHHEELGNMVASSFAHNINGESYLSALGLGREKALSERVPAKPVEGGAPPPAGEGVPPPADGAPPPAEGAPPPAEAPPPPKDALSDKPLDRQRPEARKTPASRRPSDGETMMFRVLENAAEKYMHDYMRRGDDGGPQRRGNAVNDEFHSMLLDAFDVHDVAPPAEKAAPEGGGV